MLQDPKLLQKAIQLNFIVTYKILSEALKFVLIKSHPITTAN